MRSIFAISTACLVGLLLQGPLVPAAAEAGDRPNFVVFLVDDVGYGDIGCFGNEIIKTPNLDRMATEGVKFTDFYVHPVCGVTRAALMTGCYAMRVGEVGNRKHGHPVLHPEETTIAEVLRPAGYATALIGKWHLGGPGNGGPRIRQPADLMPNAQGFDYFFGTPTHNGFTRTISGSRHRTQLVRNDRVLDPGLDQQGMDQLTRRYTREAEQWIVKHKERPFFLLIAHNMAHVVLGASEQFRGASARSLYGDVIQELDWSMGRIRQVLRENGLAENTLVIFTSDNGPWVEDHLAGATPRDDHYGRTGGLRGYKMTTWEGGVRVPTIACWPGKVPGNQVCRQPATIMDLLPTFAAMAGAELPEGRTLDGRDIGPLLTNPQEARSPHEAIYHYAYTHLQAVRAGDWKLVRPRPAKPKWCLWSARMIDAVAEPRLFNLVDDPNETTDLAAEHPGVVARLSALLEQGRREIGDYNLIGSGQRFFADGPKRPDARRWIGGAGGG